MADPKDKEIYPRFEFRLSHAELEWLNQQLAALKAKFSEKDFAVTKRTLMINALRHGFRHLNGHRRTKS